MPLWRQHHFRGALPVSDGRLNRTLGELVPIVEYLGLRHFPPYLIYHGDTQDLIQLWRDDTQAVARAPGTTAVKPRVGVPRQFHVLDNAAVNLFIIDACRRPEQSCVVRSRAHAR